MHFNRKADLNHLIDVFGNYIANVLFHIYIYIEPHPPTNLSAEIQCKQGYEIQIDWQVNTQQINPVFAWRRQ